MEKEAQAKGNGIAAWIAKNKTAVMIGGGVIAAAVIAGIIYYFYNQNQIAATAASAAAAASDGSTMGACDDGSTPDQNGMCADGTTVGATTTTPTTSGACDDGSTPDQYGVCDDGSMATAGTGTGCADIYGNPIDCTTGLPTDLSSYSSPDMSGGGGGGGMPPSGQQQNGRGSYHRNHNHGRSTRVQPNQTTNRPHAQFTGTNNQVITRNTSVLPTPVASNNILKSTPISNPVISPVINRTLNAPISSAFGTMKVPLVQPIKTASMKGDCGKCSHQYL